jgi:hypothetical protein
MKSVIIYFLILNSFIVCAQSLKESDYELKIEQTKVFKEKCYLLVSVVLYNNSKDTLKYPSYSCTWPNNYVTDDEDRIYVDIPDCDKNIPITVLIPPKESKKVELKINYPKGKSTLNFKVGMNIIESEKTIIKFKSKETQLKVLELWSKRIKIRI